MDAFRCTSLLTFASVLTYIGANDHGSGFVPLPSLFYFFGHEYYDFLAAVYILASYSFEVVFTASSEHLTKLSWQTFTFISRYTPSKSFWAGDLDSLLKRQ